MANIRRNRGYNFENNLVKKFNETDGWFARRLGGSSTGLPDIVATNNKERRLFSIEAKSTVSTHTYVPNDEYTRCGMILNMFDIYDRKNIVLAFKFGVNYVNKEKNKRRKNEIKEYYFKITADANITNLSSIRCDVKNGLTVIPINYENPSPQLLFYFYDSLENLINNKHTTFGI